LIVTDEPNAVKARETDMNNKEATTEVIPRTRKLFSYVVDHDEGRAPNPYFGFCTLCLCKYRKTKKNRQNVVERANVGDWVVGTGGASKRSAGHGKIIYAMRVDKKIPRVDYYQDRTFAKKKNGDRGDNLRPENYFQETQQFVLISGHYWYFGRKAIPIPKTKFPELEKRGPGFRSDFKESYISRFTSWLKKNYKKRGRRGKPCSRPKPRRTVATKTICK
jgi:putative DNA base modification enzyme with NMAD domain